MKVGIIGAGAIARRGHLPAYATIPEIEVAGIADVNEALAKKTAEEFNVRRYASSCQELLEDDSIELIDICTPPQTHLEVIKTAAERGKHILVEKPLTISLEDALECQKIIQMNNVKLCVVHNWRYSSSVQTVKKRISNGYLGNIVTMHGLGLTTFPTTWTLGTWLYHSGGCLYDFGPHLIDIILSLKDFAPVKKVYALGGDISHEHMNFINYAVLNIEFDDGSVITADISWVTSAASKFSIDIHGTGGSIFLDVRNNVFSESHGFTTPLDDLDFFLNKMWKTGKGVITGNYFKGPNLYYKPLILDFIRAIKGDGMIPVPVEEAVLTNAILRATEESIWQGKPIYFKEWFNTKEVERLVQ